ncbi:MAG: hypothetical protein CYPHOPRED_005099 [Cyphobasidiales sp. Tagirdzhanova-0007]|nr:MAG: hypothetical protein CYPHOPRED_005099 [Cyphobasidiales sp. Tagirdzhanova-0007]
MAKSKGKRDMDKFVVDDDDDAQDDNGAVQTDDEDFDEDANSESSGVAVRAKSKVSAKKTAAKASGKDKKSDSKKEKPAKRRKVEADEEDEQSDEEDSRKGNAILTLSSFKCPNTRSVDVVRHSTSKTSSHVPSKPAKFKPDSSKPAAQLSRDADGMPFGDLGNKKRVTVREFKGKILIDIREFYEDKNTEEIKPGKKGISLSFEQWETLKEHFIAVSISLTFKKLPSSGPPSGLRSHFDL